MNKIKQLRLEKGVKQAELAEYLNIAQNTLSYWESGKYDIDNKSLKKIAEYFETTSDYILGLSDDPRPESKKNSPPPPDIKWGDFGISFHGTPTEEDKEMIVDSINFAMEQRKKRNEAKAKEQNEK